MTSGPATVRSTKSAGGADDALHRSTSKAFDEANACNSCRRQNSPASSDSASQLIIVIYKEEGSPPHAPHSFPFRLSVRMDGRTDSYSYII